MSEKKKLVVYRNLRHNQSDKIIYNLNKYLKEDQDDSNKNEFLKNFALKFYKNPLQLGEGCTRFTLALNSKIVAKICYCDFGDPNQAELENFLKIPLISATPIVKYNYGKVSLLFSERADVRNSIRFCGGNYEFTRNKFRSIMSDIHIGNVGMIRNRLVIIDGDYNLHTYYKEEYKKIKYEDCIIKIKPRDVDGYTHGRPINRTQ